MEMGPCLYKRPNVQPCACSYLLSILVQNLDQRRDDQQQNLQHMLHLPQQQAVGLHHLTKCFRFLGISVTLAGYFWIFRALLACFTESFFFLFFHGLLQLIWPFLRQTFFVLSLSFVVHTLFPHFHASFPFQAL